MLTIRNLSKTYGNGVRALHDVSLDISKGMFGLLGPNGAGKSTLMRTIATLQEPDSGSIEFDGIDVLEQPDLLRRQLGYAPQDFGVYPRISGRAMLDHLAHLKGMTDKRERHRLVDDTLRQVNLFEVANKSLGSYSGGMRQRWGIAQALIGQPKLLIVDEPTAGLDPGERNRFHNLLSGVGDNVVILSTHIVDDVEKLCSAMAIMDGGEIVAQGVPAEMIQALDGRMWSKKVAPGSFDEHRMKFRVLASRMSGGLHDIHVLSDIHPGEGFVPLRPDLEHVYFAALAPRRAQGVIAEAAA
ncbi:MAG TPA: ABC transporter ATP-binding protein [Povalibacter sp.]|nr:ABC transporter ATP-binding protein [Povalibacter sp.]